MTKSGFRLGVSIAHRTHKNGPLRGGLFVPVSHCSIFIALPYVWIVFCGRRVDIRRSRMRINTQGHGVGGRKRGEVVFAGENEMSLFLSLSASLAGVTCG